VIVAFATFFVLIAWCVVVRLLTRVVARRVISHTFGDDAYVALLATLLTLDWKLLAP
jgi:hypothetical protein